MPASLELGSGVQHYSTDQARVQRQRPQGLHWYQFLPLPRLYLHSCFLLLLTHCIKSHAHCLGAGMVLNEKKKLRLAEVLAR